MSVVLRKVTREAADAILAGRRPSELRAADDYPTEFSTGVAQAIGKDGQVGPFFIHRADDDLVVGELGGAFVDEGTIEIGYAVVASLWSRGYATAAVEAFVALARERPDARRIVGHAPLDRPQSARVLEKAGFTMTRETDDDDEHGGVVRVQEWELEL